ncbi:hypothetical protein ELD05_11670 [Caldicellulosiruptor changbaiensis]|uniref:Uncharacterized protein n=1 Tax=Caldicellulosiruptor changbaiensis TaxID=1222016 RepID=A0A3T0D7W5_9FIRM|nr:hypothetical protein [Caldicellulosiruptor changbaiensis]AZT91235.1 hypothetical protein ELD05_11670 [Caldicellulosiruptor changbaiensis]
MKENLSSLVGPTFEEIEQIEKYSIAGGFIFLDININIDLSQIISAIKSNLPKITAASAGATVSAAVSYYYSFKKGWEL